uniref:Urease accessory protein UreH-like transmembrane domain-containing protein n=1 Tax=candidate division WOR-3 bacterium TaxID=2052148 RepID=A0A7C3UQ82_UNCW3
MVGLLNLFLLGLTTSFGPCLFLCTPLIVPLIFTQRKHFIFLFLFSRLLSFLLLSFLAFLSGKILSPFFHQYRSLVFIVAGLFIFFLGIWSFSQRGIIFCPRRFKWENKYLFAIILGIILGFLPCPPSLAVLTYVILEGKNVFYSLLLGLAFGLGEISFPIFLTFFSQPFLSKTANDKSFRIVQVFSFLLLLLIGFQLLVKGLIRSY